MAPGSYIVPRRRRPGSVSSSLLPFTAWATALSLLLSATPGSDAANLPLESSLCAAKCGTCPVVCTSPPPPPPPQFNTISQLPPPSPTPKNNTHQSPPASPTGQRQTYPYYYFYTSSAPSTTTTTAAIGAQLLVLVCLWALVPLPFLI